MPFTYSKDEKLKSKKLIETLFTEGKSVSKYPLRLVYYQVDFENNSNIKISVSVSKKHFKNAVDRNYFKRVLRECYRLNKDLLTSGLEKKYCFMFLYQTKEKLRFEEINQKTIQLFEKFNATIHKDNEKDEN
ncbi:ribonuclease P protein component [Flavobacterium lutivivi]|jgi:ribonuclease P protein component|nr:ribonuclease P protein component [Flavobacterium lutivivi]